MKKFLLSWGGGGWGKNGPIAMTSSAGSYRAGKMQTNRKRSQSPDGLK